MRTIEVLPLDGGWKVVLDGVANDLVFRSGRQAEATARQLAQRLAHSGVPSELRIHLRDGALAARLLTSALRREALAAA